MTLPFLWVVLVFASARITRLVVTDTVTQDVRAWLLRRSRTQPWKFAAGLTSCPWCLGAHVSGWLVLVVWLVGYDLPLPWLWWPSVAGGQMIVNGADLSLDKH